MNEPFDFSQMQIISEQEENGNCDINCDGSSDDGPPGCDCCDNSPSD